MHDAIKPAFRRLFDAQKHWHHANQSYFDPESFRISVNSCIQELRNVTFVLQSNKRQIPDFDAWYKPWQERMRQNELLRWLVEARNRIVKQGDLELNSILRIAIIGSYLENEVPKFERLYDPNISNDDILKVVMACGLSKDIIEESYIKIERRWVDKNYQSDELLKLLAICWSKVSELLFDAPSEGIEDLKNQLSSCKLPPCMYQGSETHSTWMKIHDNKLIPTKLENYVLDPSQIDDDKIKERYKDSPLFTQPDKPSNFKETCELLFNQAMYVLKKDGYHVHLAMIFVNSIPAHITEIHNEDQLDKYRSMRLLASEIEKIGGNQFVMISEVWRASYDPEQPYKKASESSDRSEVLSLLGVTRDGEGLSFTVPFTRNDGDIEFGELEKCGISGFNIIQPILSVWGISI